MRPPVPISVISRTEAADAEWVARVVFDMAARAGHVERPNDEHLDHILRRRLNRLPFAHGAFSFFLIRSDLLVPGVVFSFIACGLFVGFKAG